MIKKLKLTILLFIILSSSQETCAFNVNLRAPDSSWLGTTNGFNVYVKNADIHDACGWSPQQEDN